MGMERMMAFVALNGNTSVSVDVEHLGAGAGGVPCFECDGTGDQSYLIDFVSPECIRDGRVQCGDCKGTGFVLIGV